MTGLRFDLTTLRLFAAVAELRSISKAAQREGIAVSALSKRITDLESDIGASLLARLPRGVELTPAGSALLHHTTLLLNNLQQMEGDLSEYGRGVRGHVRMLVNESALVGCLPEELGEFVRHYPDIKIDLRGENSGPIVRAVAEGMADIGIFTAGLMLPRGLVTIPYRSDRLAVIVPLSHELAARTSLCFEETLAYDFIGLGVGSAWNDAVAKAAALRLGVVDPKIRDFQMPEAITAADNTWVGFRQAVSPACYMPGMGIVPHFTFLIACNRWWLLPVSLVFSFFVSGAPTRRKIAIGMLIAGLGLTNFLVGPLLCAWLLYRSGELATGQIIDTYRTSTEINDRDVVGYHVLIRDANGSVFASRFEDDEFNVFPPSGFSEPTPGESFGVRFLPRLLTQRLHHRHRR